MTERNAAEAPAPLGPVERGVRPSAEALQPIAYLYHDAATAEVLNANPMVHSTLLVLASDRRPWARNETEMYALTPEEVAAVNKLRARKEWMARDTARCKCDHNEYCQHCYPESFRPGGVWHGIGA